MGEGEGEGERDGQTDTKTDRQRQRQRDAVCPRRRKQPIEIYISDLIYRKPSCSLSPF